MIKNIQALRAIAAILVLLAHMTVIEQKYFSGRQLLSPYLSIGISGVDLFFVISGFIMVYVTRNAGKGIFTAGKYIAHRAVRIYPLYWFYSILVLCVFLMRPGWVNSSQPHPPNILNSFLLLPLPVGDVPLLGVGWTLIHEMYFYLVFSVILLLSTYLRGIALLLWFIIVIVCGLILFPGSPSAATELVLHPLTLEFIAGCALGYIFLSGRGRYGLSSIVFAIIFWVVVYVMYARAVGQGMAPVEWRRPLVFGIPAFLVCYGLVILERDSDLRLPWWLVRVGDASYSIYLSHLLVISALGRLWRLSGLSGFWYNSMALIVIFFSAIVAGILSYRWIEKPVQKWMRYKLDSWFSSLQTLKTKKAQAS